MQFDSWQSFWAMGGYGLYVWLSFGVTFGVMIIMAFTSFKQHKSLLKNVLAEKERQQRIKAARQQKKQLVADEPNQEVQAVE